MDVCLTNIRLQHLSFCKRSAVHHWETNEITLKKKGKWTKRGGREKQWLFDSISNILSDFMLSCENTAKLLLHLHSLILSWYGSVDNLNEKINPTKSPARKVWFWSNSIWKALTWDAPLHSSGKDKVAYLWFSKFDPSVLKNPSTLMRYAGMPVFWGHAFWQFGIPRNYTHLPACTTVTERQALRNQQNKHLVPGKSLPKSPHLQLLRAACLEEINRLIYPTPPSPWKLTHSDTQQMMAVLAKNPIHGTW